MTAPAWHSSFSRMKQRPHVLVVTPQAVGQTWIDAIEAAAAGRTELWPWQVAGARYAAERPYAMLAMEMRTGKTLTALHAVGVADREVRPLLLNEGSTERRAAALRQALATESRPIVVVTNGDAVWRGDLGQAIAGVSWSAIIIDESHQIKSPTGRKSKWLAALARKYPTAKRLCLTGTPLAHSPLDIFGQTRFLDPTVFGASFPAFRARHMIGDRQFPARPASRWQLKSAGLSTPWKNLDELTAKMDTFTYRVRRADVMECLPTTTDTIGVTLSPVTMRYYRQLEREMTAAVGDGTVTAANVLTKGIRLRQACGGRAVLDGTKCTVDIDGRAAKAAALKDWLEGLPDDEPVPVFCEFVDDLDAVAQIADELGRPYSEVSGRGKTLAEWQCGETTILGVQTRSGGLGVDLTRANLAVFYSLGWSLAEHEQALARLQGVNQKRPVGYYVLTAKGTIDEQVYSALAERRDVVEAVLGRLTGVAERGVA